MSQNQNFTSEGRLRATITAILETVNGVNTQTGEAYTYVIVECTSKECAQPIKRNIFIDKFNPLADIKVGAAIDIVTSKNVTTGKINQRVFLGNKYATNEDVLRASGCTADVVAAGKTQAADAIRARMAARKAAREF